MTQTGTEPMAIIEAAGLSVSLGGQKVLEVASLRLLPGEVLGIIGPNGSGKTTLLLSLSLLLKPTAGTVSYGGKTVATGADRLQARRRFAVVFQEPLLLSGTVWDNVTLGLRLRGVEKEDIKERAHRWLGRFGIASLSERQAKTLSGGEAKRVSLARSFALQPEVIFLDEPFAALDAPTRQSLLEDFGGILNETRVSTLFVTHDRNEAMALTHRVAVLVLGQLRQLGSPEEVYSFPVDEEVAGFVEAGNVLHGLVTSQDGGLASVEVGDQSLEAVSDMPAGSKVAFFLPQDQVTLSRPLLNPSSTSARNSLPGKVVRVFPVDSQLRVTVDCGFPLVSLITKRSWDDMKLDLGEQVVATFKASSVHLIRRL